jgi:hypothetical protein
MADELRSTLVVDGVDETVNRWNQVAEASLRYSDALKQVHAAQAAATETRSEENLKNLGEALARAATAQRALGEANAASVGNVERMEHTMARMAGHMAFEAVPGMSRMGRLIEMLGVQAAGVGPVLAALVPVGIIAAGISIFEAYEKKQLETAKASMELKESEDRQSDELLKLHEEYIGITEGPLAKYRAEIEDMPKMHVVLKGAIEDTNKVLETQSSFWQATADNIRIAWEYMKDMATMGIVMGSAVAAGTTISEKSNSELEAWIYNWIEAHDTVDKMRAGLKEITEEEARLAATGAARAGPQIAALTRLYQDAQRSIGAEDEKLHNARLRAATDTVKEELEGSAAILGATEKRDTALVDATLHRAKETAKINKDAWGEEIAAERVHADELYRIKTEALLAKRARVEAEPEISPIKRLAEVVAINHEIEAAQVEHDDKLKSLDAEVTDHFVAGQKTIQDSTVANFERQVRQQAESDAQARRGAEILAERKRSAAAQEQEFADGQIEQQRTAVEQASSLGTLSFNQKIAKLKDLALAQYDAQEKTLEIDLKAYEDDYEKYQETLNKMKLARQKYEAEVQKLQNQEVLNMQQGMTKMTDSFDSALFKWTSGQERWRYAWVGMWANVVNTAFENIVKITEKFIAGKVAETIAARTAETAQTANLALAAAQREAIETGSASLSILKSAKSAAAKAWDALSDIPVVGPALGAAAAAATFAGVMALAAFQKGGQVGATGLALVHETEVVSPSWLTPAFKALGEGTLGGGGTHNVSLHQGPISALDAKGVDRVLARRNQQFQNAVARMLRGYGATSRGGIRR